MSSSDEDAERSDGSGHVLASKRKSKKLLGQRTNTKAQWLLGADNPHHLPEDLHKFIQTSGAVQTALLAPAFLSPLAVLQLVGVTADELTTRITAAAIMGLGVCKYTLSDNGFSAVHTLTSVEGLVSTLAATGNFLATALMQTALYTFWSCSFSWMCHSLPHLKLNGAVGVILSLLERPAARSVPAYIMFGACIASSAASFLVHRRLTTIARDANR
ncbi:hypothetical protein CAOG_006711 [Capsaspora owczarzaki ATCC 30864]|uniref:Uncharacterized protein n=1 Tax=Capsaspora owczarzaki (strain ATCC 30864) TaxID=595528 RepID=A0A0D2WUJ4_CAPO3|nr:hypothetical protein CAOG_006711 [Capsaspora owczarzaki ATCC 30864]